MREIILILALLQAAHGAAKATPAPVQVMLLDKDIPAEPFRAKGVETTSSMDEGSTFLPEKKEADRVFSEAKLGSAADGWDQMDRDLYLLSARTDTLDELSRKYPKVSREAHARFLAALKRRAP